MTELDEKTDRLVRMLARNNLDAVILNAQHNFAWITCGGTNGVDLSRENGAASIIVTREGERYLLASVIEIERMLAEEVSVVDFEPIDFNWQGEKADPASVLEKARYELNTGSVIATDVPLFADAMPIEGKIAACRFSLTTGERERYRQLGRDASDAMMRCIRSTLPGHTEREIAEVLRHELATANIASVVTLVAADLRIAEFRHPVPSENRWEMTLLIVTCAKRGGLIASLSRMVNIGEPNDELKKRTEAAARVNAALLDAMRPGRSGAELYHVAAAAYSDAGFSIEVDRHHQGGATGYRTRDWVAHPMSDETVQPWQAFAWNPSIAGTKIEETILVTRNGLETFTTSPEFPVIVTTINGHEFHSPGILSI